MKNAYATTMSHFQGSKVTAKTITDLKNLKETYNPFKAQMEKVIELKIYLKYNFHKTDIDDKFLSDLESEYANQYLDKMGLLPTKVNIEKILKFRPLEQCDFHLTLEQLRNKPIKLIHIYPNNKSDNNGKSQGKLQKLLSSEEFEEAMSKTIINAKSPEDKLANIKKREIKKEEMQLFNRDIVDSLIQKAKDEIVDKQLYIQSQGMTNQNLRAFDLSIENLRERYLNPNAQIILDTRQNDKINAKAKFQNFEKAQKRRIFTDTKYEFPFLNTELNTDILNEVGNPINVGIEVIRKDINYILDNLPIDQLINFDEGNDNKDNFSKTAGEAFDSLGAHKATHSMFYKIKSIDKKEIVYVYKKLLSPGVFHIIGLLIHLLYWIVFGFINRVQIDMQTKQNICFKLLEQLNKVETEFAFKKVYHKVFMPLLILVLRIESEAIFQRKFKTFFEKKENLDLSMERINELITILFDPNCYFNTFTMLGSNMSKLKHKLSKKIYPQYKSKINCTSNLVDQLFTRFQNEHNVKKFLRIKGGSDVEDVGYLNQMNDEDWEKEKNYIVESKVGFFRVLLNKINQNLKKRNLDPIFAVKKECEDQSPLDNMNNPL